MAFTEGFTPSGVDTPTSSLNKINSLLLTGFVLPAFDSIALSYFGSTNNLQTAVYSKNGGIVAQLNLTYVGGVPVTNDANLASVTRSV